MDGTVASTVTKSFTFFDTVAPTVEQTRLVGPRKVEVSFSEPLQDAPTVKLNNGSISSTVTVNSADRSKAIVEFGLEPALGSHSLEIEGGADYAGFKVEKVTETFTYAKDETAPTVVVDKAAPGSVTLKFSKPVAVKSAANVSVYHTINNSGAYVGSALTPVNAVDGFADTFTVTFNTPLAEGSSKVFLNTAANALEDEWGNDVASAELNASVVIDKVAPQVTSLTASTDKKIEVQFSKEVKAADAQLAANYVLTDSEGKAVSLAGATFVYDNAKKVTTITLPSNLKAGNYTLTVKNITDTTFAENKLTSQTVSVAVPDTTAWDITANAVQSGNNIRVTFNEAMSSEGLTSLSNYSLRDANGAVIAFPTNSSVVVVNSTTVEIRLGAEVTGLENIRVSGSLKDAAGNIFSNTDFKTVSVVADVINASSIEADSVKTTSKNTLQFKVNQELQGSLTPSHFTLSTGDVVAGASYVNNEGKATVTLTLHSSDEFAPNDTADLTIAASALKNTFGTSNAAAITSVAVADGIAPSVTKTGTTLDINDNPVTAATDFTINFDENLAASTALWSSDLVIKDTDGKTLKAGDDFELTSTGSTNVATVTLVGAYADYAGTLNVASVETPAYIRDVAGNRANAFAATTITVTSGDTVAPTVTTALGDGLADGETLAIGDHVVEFSEALNAASKTAVQDAFVAGNGEATAELTFAWTNDSTLTITVATAAATYAADVTADITDLAGNTTTGAVVLAQ